MILLAPEAQPPPRRPVAERIGPVHRNDERLDLCGVQPGRVEPADDGAHAGTGDRVDRDVEVLESAQNAQVDEAARAATGQHQSDPGTPGVGAHRARRLRSGSRLRSGGWREEERDEAENREELRQDGRSGPQPGSW